MIDDIILRIDCVSKSFPGVKALDQMSFSLKRGEVHAIVGENGAGKSTLMHILAGIYKPDKGRLILENKDVVLENSHDARMKGIAIIFQELSLIQHLSIAENIFANQQPVKWLGMVDWNQLYENTREILGLFDLQHIDPRLPVKCLPPAMKQSIEILKALATNPKILILDEPTSSLTVTETNKLYENIRKLRDRGVSCIYISHHLSEIFEIADRVTVMKDGCHVTTNSIGEISENKIVSYMVGRELKNIYGKKLEPSTEFNPIETFEVSNLCSKTYFRDVSFCIHPGEIITLTGLVGSGGSELAKALAGIHSIDSGIMLFNGQVIQIRTPKEAVQKGICYISDDRKEEGLFLDMDIKSNCIAPALGKFAGSVFKIMDEKKIRKFADACKEKYRIKTNDTGKKVRFLSGGNQQKVLLAMWMETYPKLLIIDEPTRGVDIGAKSEIYTFLRKLAQNGTRIILKSSDLMEVLGISDRIIVMRKGEIVATLCSDLASEEMIMAHAAGVKY